MDLVIGTPRTPPVGALEGDVAGRMGLGHPASSCDSGAEESSLSRASAKHLGRMLHQKLDVLCRGAERPSVGGGQRLELVAGIGELGRQPLHRSLEVERWLLREAPGRDRDGR